MTINQNVKCLYYAYPSSTTATLLGFAKQGCFYLFVGDEDMDANTGSAVVFSSPDKAAVLERAADYRCPWGNYSLYKESEDNA